MTNIVTSVTLERVGGHERVGVWVSGKKAGELVVGEGEGSAVAARLLGFVDGSEEALDLATDFEQNAESHEPQEYGT